MTCIAAVAHKGNVWMGADTATSNGHIIDNPGIHKIFRKQDLLIGCAGSIRGANLIQYALDIPKADADADPEKWLVNVFVESLRKCLLGGGHASKEDMKESMGCVLLIGFRGSIYSIWGNYLVVRHSYNYGSVGSGSDVAHGSLASTVGRAPALRVRMALKAAEQFVTTVRGPFVIKKLTKTK